MNKKQAMAKMWQRIAAEVEAMDLEPVDGSISPSDMEKLYAAREECLRRIRSRQKRAASPTDQPPPSLTEETP